MKKLFLMSAIAMSSLFYNTANAQMRVSLGLHFGSPRVYVPQRVVVAEQTPMVYHEPVNYDGNEDYYYLPDVDAYYSVTDQCYFYNDGGNWVSAAYLPGAYRDYDWRSVRHFEVRATRPFMHDDYYRNRYNGVALNGQWNRGYGRGYNNDNHVNHDQYRNDQFRNDDHRNNEVAHNEYRQPNRDEQRPSPRNFPARERDSRGNDRHGR
ncbi:MAG: hypothetical protein ACHQHN_13535 [Sphingobacteriales bacterium]